MPWPDSLRNRVYLAKPWYKMISIRVFSTSTLLDGLAFSNNSSYTEWIYITSELLEGGVNIPLRCSNLSRNGKELIYSFAASPSLFIWVSNQIGVREGCNWCTSECNCETLGGVVSLQRCKTMRVWRLACAVQRFQLSIWVPWKLYYPFLR
jgi:hypothetical protein